MKSVIVCLLVFWGASVSQAQSSSPMSPMSIEDRAIRERLVVLEEKIASLEKIEKALANLDAKIDHKFEYLDTTLNENQRGIYSQFTYISGMIRRR